MAGGSRSLTLTVKLQLTVSPLASVAVQITVFVPVTNALPLVGLQLTATPGQLSVAIVSKFTTWLHWPAAVFVTMFAGQAITGGSLSFTLTAKLHVLVLPLVSVAVQVTVLMPLAKALPLAGVQSTVTPEQLSVAIAAKFTIRLHWPSAVFVTIFAGQVTTGASVSLTVMLKLQLVEFPETSVAVQLTAVTPLAKALPFVGLQLTLTPGQLSVAVAAKLTIWLH